METTQGSEVEGRRALVTASTQGTGAAIARRLRDAGAEVWTCARNAPDVVVDGVTSSQLT